MSKNTKLTAAAGLLLLLLPASNFFNTPAPEPVPLRKRPLPGYYGSWLYGHEHEKFPYMLPAKKGSVRTTIVDSATFILVPQLFPRYFKGTYWGRYQYTGSSREDTFYNVETSHWPEFTSNDLPWNY